MIDSVKNDRIKYLKKLRLSKYIKEEKRFLIEGFHLVEEAIKSGIVLELFVLENTDVNFNGKITVISRDIMNYLSTLECFSPVLALCKIFEYETKLYDRVLLLDGVQDPGNIGTIIRNAVAFNVDAIIFSEDSVNIYNDKLIRASQGMFFKIKLIETNLINYVNILKKNGIKVYATALRKNSIELSMCKNNDKYAIIFGNEGQGIRDNILNLCDEAVKIDMCDECESLNVGVSSGIVLYHFNKISKIN